MAAQAIAYAEWQKRKKSVLEVEKQKREKEETLRRAALLVQDELRASTEADIKSTMSGQPSDFHGSAGIMRLGAEITRLCGLVKDLEAENDTLREFKERCVARWPEADELIRKEMTGERQEFLCAQLQHTLGAAVEKGGLQAAFEAASKAGYESERNFDSTIPGVPLHPAGPLRSDSCEVVCAAAEVEDDCSSTGTQGTAVADRASQRAQSQFREGSKPQESASMTSNQSNSNPAENFMRCTDIAMMKLREGVAAPKDLLEPFQQDTEYNLVNLVKYMTEPNIKFENVQHAGLPRMTFCTPLTIAALRGHIELVKQLVDRNADPNSEYGFIAGARQIEWRGTTANVPVAADNLPLLQELVRCKADVKIVGSNGASLLWQAAYFSKSTMVTYLLAKKSHVEQRATSQDDEALSYTPLHAAAKAGHELVVTALLDAHANPNVGDSAPTRGGDSQASCASAVELFGRSVLEDAIENGHVKVVKLLIQKAANVFQRIPGNDHLRCLDLAFDSHNSVLVSAVAEGLRLAKPLLDQLTREDLIRFLECDGQVPCHILRAVFQAYDIRYWSTDSEGRKNRHFLNRAIMNKGTEMVARPGAHHNIIQKMFITKESPPDHIMNFMDSIAPQTRHTKKTVFGPVAFLMCHVPEVHEHLDVFFALANNKCDAVFDEPGCKAILTFATDKPAHISAIRKDAFVAVVEVFNLVCINVVLNKTLELKNLESTRKTDGLLLACCVIAQFVNLLDVFHFLQKAVGYWWQGVLRQFARHWFDGVVLLVTFGVVGYTQLIGYEAKDSALYSTLLGILVFIKWMLLLKSLSQFRLVGLHVLPIQVALADIGPFVLVTSVCLAGCANLYYALGITDLFSSIIKIYSLVVMEEYDLREMEKTGSVQDTNMRVTNDNHIVQDLAIKTDYYFVIRVMMIVLSFGFGVSLMNLFIAVLTVSYSRAKEKDLILFSRLQAHKVIETQAIRIGWAVAKKYLCFADRVRKAGRRLSHVLSTTVKQSSTLNEDNCSICAKDLLDESYRRDGEEEFCLFMDDKFMWVCHQPTDQHVH